MLSRLQSVRTYFDSDAARYGENRYPDDPVTCEQLSYLVRRHYVLSMLDRGNTKPRLALDLGCGPGVYTRGLLDRGARVWSVDLAPRMLEVARQKVSGSSGAGFAVGQTTRLPFAEQSFDALVCIGVLAYVEDDEATLREIARVLRPGACAVIQIANVYAPIRGEYRLREVVGRWLRGARKDEEDVLREQVKLSAHEPRSFKEACRRAGLVVHEQRYYDFRPLLLTRTFPRLALAIGRAFERVGHMPLLGWWGAGFLVRLEREPA